MKTQPPSSPPDPSPPPAREGEGAQPLSLAARMTIALLVAVLIGQVAWLLVRLPRLSGRPAPDASVSARSQQRSQAVDSPFPGAPPTSTAPSGGPRAALPAPGPKPPRPPASEAPPSKPPLTAADVAPPRPDEETAPARDADEPAPAPSTRIGGLPAGATQISPAWLHAYGVIKKVTTSTHSVEIEHDEIAALKLKAGVTAFACTSPALTSLVAGREVEFYVDKSGAAPVVVAIYQRLPGQGPFPGLPTEASPSSGP